MKYAIEVVPFGEFGDARVLMRLAQAAEAAGWDGLFVWDHLGYVFGMDSGDAWVLLSAAAAVTERIRLGTSITPLPRRRPQVLAQTLTTLDHLSNGRLIFGAGAGGTEIELDVFGEPTDIRRRAGMLDEGLEILDRWFGGETLEFSGQYYTVKDVALRPRPVQSPRIPIWIGGKSKPALRRAARWDGWTASGVNEAMQMVHSPEWLAEQVAYILEHRTRPEPFDVTISGISAPGQADLPRPYAAAGATWWFELLYGYRGTVEEMLARVLAGPPKD